MLSLFVVNLKKKKQRRKTYGETCIQYHPPFSPRSSVLDLFVLFVGIFLSGKRNNGQGCIK